MKQKIISKGFEAAVGAGFGKERAQKYGEALKNLVKKTGKIITPRDVLEEAKPKDSPLHDFFVWDNTKAAEKYRIWQARFLLNRMREIILTSSGEEKTVRAFYHINLSEEERQEDMPNQYYVPLQALQDDEIRRQIIMQALQELKQWQIRYKEYQELENIFSAIDSLQLNL